MVWIDGSTGLVADRGVIVKVTVISWLDSVRFDMIHVWPLLLRGLLLRWGHGNAVRTAGRRSLPKRKVCEMRQPGCTGTSYDPEPISGEATPKRARKKAKR